MAKIVCKLTVLKKLHFMDTVKKVCNESMIAAQEEVKNRPGYYTNGEVCVMQFMVFLRSML